MSVKQVPMWRVECDACGKGNDGEYWALSQKVHAIDEWVESDDFILSDGRAFHRDCLPGEFCPLGARDDGYAHTPDEDRPGVCVECEEPIPVETTEDR